MELPWLKNKNKNQGGGGPSLEMKAAPTREREDSMDDIMDKVADEFLQAVETKNKQLLRDALAALVLHIQDEDKEQDERDSV